MISGDGASELGPASGGTPSFPPHVAAAWPTTTRCDSGGESTCYGEWAANWPALETYGEPQSSGGGHLAAGDDPARGRHVQVTYNERPLYHFAADEAPGDTNGQGVGDVWYVVSPEGEPIQA